MLCDVSEKFIDVCFKDYGLDPCHYFSSPGLAWDAMLKMTDIKLEKINDIDMYLFLEKGTRGGILYISKRHSKSSNHNDILYWDMNNLYGWAMGCNYLPYGGFKWLNKKEIDNFDVFSIKENSNSGYILELDLEYCEELHNLHNDYPLCPELIKINYGMLSDVGKVGKVGNVKKLIPNLYNKIKHPIHYRNLQYSLKLGMKLIKIHRILSFKQKKWLKIFTDFNTKKKRLSNDEFNKNLHKLFNNCIYGKSIENPRKKIKDQKIVNKPNFISQKIIDKNLVAIHCKKILNLNKPIYIGFCILELSKLLMYQFHYDNVFKTFGNVKLLFTDTDSLVYEIKNGNVYDKCFKDKELFDFSGYDENSIYYNDSNKKNYIK